MWGACAEKKKDVFYLSCPVFLLFSIYFLEKGGKLSLEMIAEPVVTVLSTFSALGIALEL